MIFYQKILLSIFIILFLGLASTNLEASPISYSFSEYRASMNGIEDIKFIPPALVEYRAGFYGYVVVDYNGIGVYSDPYVSTQGYGQIDLKFIATFPAVGINLDYGISTSANATEAAFQSTSSTSEINFSLMDTTDVQTIWSGNRSAFAQGRKLMGDARDESGSINELLALIIGHEYELILSATVNTDDPNLFGASSNVYIGSLTVEAIPLPATVLLLGSGLLSLVGWRRFRKS